MRYATAAVAALAALTLTGCSDPADNIEKEWAASTQDERDSTCLLWAIAPDVAEGIFEQNGLTDEQARDFLDGHCR